MNETANTLDLVARLRSDVEARFGRAMQVARDFDDLSETISMASPEQVSATTLKRMWGYINEPVTPRLSTLDILSQFVGYADFDDYGKQVTGAPRAAH